MLVDDLAEECVSGEDDFTAQGDVEVLEWNVEHGCAMKGAEGGGGR